MIISDQIWFSYLFTFCVDCQRFFNFLTLFIFAVRKSSSLERSKNNVKFILSFFLHEAQ